ncbi:MAG: leucine-rich repeat domain-containing protein [Candidatus Lokiarchaeota archaeon]|nr:leucine-rich repeat domain-containing protein [Candidatus Lokiarchaeota archaeon]
MSKYTLQTKERSFFFSPYLWKALIADLLKTISDPLVVKRLYELNANLEKITQEVANGFKKALPIESLYLYDWQVSFLPESIETLTEIKELSIYSDVDDDKEIPLKELPENLDKLVNLEELFVQHTQLEEFPESACGLKNLKRLELSLNHISTLPERIGELKELEYLDLTQNAIDIIPETIGRLKCLKELILVDNQLANLPESIGGLDSLEVLDLSDNCELECLPDTITRLKNLKSVSLLGCDSLSLSSEQENWLYNLDGELMF